MAGGAWERGVGKSLRTGRTSEQQLAAHAMDCRFECVPRATRVDATRQIVPPSPSQNNYSVTIANQPGSIDFTKHCEV